MTFTLTLWAVPVLLTAITWVVALTEALAIYAGVAAWVAICGACAVYLNRQERNRCNRSQ